MFVADRGAGKIAEVRHGSGVTASDFHEFQKKGLLERGLAISAYLPCAPDDTDAPTKSVCQEAAAEGKARPRERTSRGHRRSTGRSASCGAGGGTVTT